MTRKKRNSTSEQFIEMIIELTDMFWLVGAVATIIFIGLGFLSLDWAVNKNHPVDPTTIDSAVFTSMGWLFYGIPLMLFGIAITMAIRIFISYQKINRF